MPVEAVLSKWTVSLAKNLVSDESVFSFQFPVVADQSELATPVQIGQAVVMERFTALVPFTRATPSRAPAEPE